MMDDNHALLVGNVVGALMRLNDDVEQKVDVEVDGDGNYTNRVFVTRPSGRYVVTVERAED